MLERGTHTRPDDRRGLIIAGLIAAVIIVVVAFFWTTHDRQAARNDARTGTTSETSPRNPTPAPGGGSEKGG